MSWEITITIKGTSTPEVFEIDNHDYRLLVLEGQTNPKEWVKTVDDVTENIWKNVQEVGAYTHVIDNRSVTIPLNNILKMEITQR